MPLCFAYGTLKRNERLNPYYFGDPDLATYIGEARTEALYDIRSVHGGIFPYVIPVALITDEKVIGSQIVGELWAVDDKIFNVLRAMEEGAGYYTEEIHLAEEAQHDWDIDRAMIFLRGRNSTGNNQIHIHTKGQLKWWST